MTAMKYGLRLARTLTVPIDVLHVVPSIGPARFLDLDAAAADDSSVRDVLNRLRSAAAGYGDVDVRFHLGRSPLPGPAILEMAKQQESSLILLGAHGLRAGKEGQLGSVAAELIQRSSCPVMLVPERVPEAAADADVERIVTYISFAHLVEPVLVFAFQMARMFGAHLDILALTNGQAAKEAVHAVEQSPEDLQSVLHRQLLRAVESESMHNGQPFEDVKVHVRGGHDAETILRFAQDQRSDLLVIEAPGLAAFESPLERMVERIVNDAPCPVIVVNTCGHPGVGMRKRRRTASVLAAAT